MFNRVYNFLNQPTQDTHDRYFSQEEIINSLIQKYPEYQNLNRGSTVARVSLILSDLERQGLAETERFRHDFRSEVVVSEEQRSAISSLIKVIDEFKDGDRETIRTGREFAQRVANDRNLFSELMLKAKEASPGANQTSKEETRSNILSILQQHPNASGHQILEYLRKDYNKSLLRDGLNVHLRGLTKDKIITSQNTKSGNVYRVVGESNQENTTKN